MRCHANIIANYDETSSQKWNNLFVIKDIKENEQLFINYSVDTYDLCPFKGSHRLYYIVADFEYFGQVIHTASRKQLSREHRAESAAKRTFDELKHSEY